MRLWEHWLNFVVGLWLILSAFLGFSAYTMAINVGISGLIVALFSLIEGVQYGSANEREHRHA